MPDIDPTSLDDIEQMIRFLMRKVSACTNEVRTRAIDAGAADTTYRVAYAKAFLRAEGPVATREAQATVDTADELAVRKNADALLISAREAGQNAREQLAAARTLSANIRSAVSNASGYGG